MNTVYKISDKDNVVIALKNFKCGELFTIGNNSIEIKEPIDKGNKIALTDIKNNELIIKYGFSIGHAIEDIKQGFLVHTHNIKTNLSNTIDYTYTPKIMKEHVSLSEREINVYQRSNGDVAIRNEIWVIPTVGCVNGISDQIVNEFKKRHTLDDIDGVFVFKHQFGCSQLGGDHENTKLILGDLVKHPNAGGCLVVGLGCENNQISAFKESLNDYDENRVMFLNSQDVVDEIENGVKKLEFIYQSVRFDKRQKMPIGKLKIGLECGGSDGFSGLTANPLLGKFSDYIINYGGTSVLTEVPEMFGAEHLLFERCNDKKTFDKAVNMVNDFKQYFIDHNQPIYENPSPGNKKGGISTLEDKSLGCTQKSGSSSVIDVLKYGEKIKQNGLLLLNAPGNDPIATTALCASGCHIVLFTTGRGTPYGGVVPTIKVSSNNTLAEKKKNWIDFNAGKLLTGTSMEDLLEEFVDRIVAVANGELTCNEKNNMREIAIFKSGVTL